MSGLFHNQREAVPCWKQLEQIVTSPEARDDFFVVASYCVISGRAPEVSHDSSSMVPDISDGLLCCRYGRSIVSLQDKKEAIRQTGGPGTAFPCAGWAKVWLRLAVAAIATFASDYAGGHLRGGRFQNASLASHGIAGAAL